MKGARQHLSETRLRELAEIVDLAAASPAEVVELVRHDPALQAHLPPGRAEVDPRSNEQTIFSPSRRARPHRLGKAASGTQVCPICAGRTTGVIDLAPLSEGFTFVNKNLYPALTPHAEAAIRGLHLVQWTSTYHDVDWHNLPAADQPIVMGRLARLEGLFVRAADASGLAIGLDLHVTIIKNAGGAVGASLPHGHQQILISGIMPARTTQNRTFQVQHGSLFSEHLLRRVGPDLVVAEYGSALLAVPPFMKRPYEMVLLLKDERKSYLHQMSDRETEDFARGWHEASRALHRVMPAMGRTVAFNITLSNGPGAGLYSEFLPATQVQGGFERLGVHISQAIPAAAAEELRQALEP